MLIPNLVFIASVAYSSICPIASGEGSSPKLSNLYCSVSCSFIVLYDSLDSIAASVLADPYIDIPYLNPLVNFVAAASCPSLSIFINVFSVFPAVLARSSTLSTLLAPANNLFKYKEALPSCTATNGIAPTPSVAAPIIAS